LRTPRQVNEIEPSDPRAFGCQGRTPLAPKRIGVPKLVKSAQLKKLPLKKPLLHLGILFCLNGTPFVQANPPSRIEQAG
jgi:hypothetical protein